MKGISTSLAKVRRSWVRGTLLTLAVLLLLVSVVLAAGTPTVDWWVIGGGGGHMEAPPYVLRGTIGQAVVGVDTNHPSQLCSGFWCGAGGDHNYYLPVILRNF